MLWDANVRAARHASDSVIRIGRLFKAFPFFKHIIAFTKWMPIYLSGKMRVVLKSPLRQRDTVSPNSEIRSLTLEDDIQGNI